MSMPGPNDPASAYPSDVVTTDGVATSVCWFEGAGLPAPTVSQLYALSWQPYAGPGFTDTRVDPEDPTAIEVLTAGVYVFSAEATCEAEDPTTVTVAAALTPGWLGSLGLLKGDTYTPGDGWSITSRVSSAIELAVGDRITVAVAASAADVSVTSSNLTLLRTGVIPAVELQI